MKAFNTNAVSIKGGSEGAESRFMPGDPVAELTGNELGDGPTSAIWVARPRRGIGRTFSELR